MNIGFFTLTKEPNEQVLNFTNSINDADIGIEAFIVIDFDSKLSKKSDKYLYVSDEKCYDNYYKNMNDIIGVKKGSAITAWDKVLYILNRVKYFKKFDFVWIVEDDVFIPSIQSIEFMTQKYNSYDLVISANESFTKDKGWAHRNKRPSKSLFPRDDQIYKSMACAIGISRKFLNIIDVYAIENKSLFFLELFFNTLAHKYRMNVKLAPELRTILYQYREYSGWNWEIYAIEKVLYKRNAWFHPLKNLELHSVYRKYIQESIPKNFESNKLNENDKYALVNKTGYNLPKICPNEDETVISFVLNFIDNIITAKNGDDIKCNSRKNFADYLTKEGFDEKELNKVMNRKYSFYNIIESKSIINAYTLSEYLN